MSYHDLSECTLSPDERVEEKDRLIKMLEGVTDFTASEIKFLESIESSGYVSVKQLFWLRDIKDKYL